MSNNGKSNKNNGPKKFTTTPPAGAVSPVGLRFSSNSNYENNLSSIGGNGNSERGNLNALSNFGNRSVNGNGKNAFWNKNRTSKFNQKPRVTVKNMYEYPVLGGKMFSNTANPEKPGKRNNRKTGRKMRKNKKSRKTRKNRK